MAAPWFYSVGWDVGSLQDFSAVAALEVRLAPDPLRPHTLVNHYACRHLERFELGVNYVTQLKRVAALMRTPPLPGRSRLAVDRTGVGQAPLDLLRGMALPTTVYGVLIHAGNEVTREGLNFAVPKRELVGLLNLLLNSGRLRIEKALPLAAVLEKEMNSFQVRITPNAHDEYGSWREQDHDDMVLAVACAAFIAERTRPQGEPSAGGRPPPRGPEDGPAAFGPSTRFLGGAGPPPGQFLVP